MSKGKHRKLDELIAEKTGYIPSQEWQAEFKQQIKDLIKELIGNYSMYASTETDKYADGYNQGIADLILELKAKADKL